MTFQHPNAVPPIDNTGLEIDDSEHSKDIIGDEAINRAVEHTIPGYDEKLGLHLATSAHERHHRLGGLAFGKIAKDIARLRGLAAAIENISQVVKGGKDQLAQDWKGKSYDAFRTNIENLEKTLDDYRAAVEVTARGLDTALSGIRTGYQNYRDHCLGSHFNWGRLAPPDTWWKMSADKGQYLADHCISWHGVTGDCFYDEDDVVAIIDGKLTNNRLFNDELEKWDCTDNLAVAVSQYAYVVKSAEDERDAIDKKVVAYCEEADALRDLVGKAYDSSFGNLRILAETNVFSHLNVPGATGAGDPGQGGPGQVDPGPGGPGEGDPGPGGHPGGGTPGGDATAMPPGAEPAQVDPTTRPDPAQVDPGQVEPAAADPGPQDAAPPGTGESVRITDGDRTISVTSPDGEGHVKVTVETGDGKTKSYDLDFDAASGMPPRPPAGDPETTGRQGDPDAEHVPAQSNGKCVIKDGPVTITAERPLFEPGTIKLEVDDGVNEPNIYTLDFDETSTDAPGTEHADQPAGRPAATGDEAAPDAVDTAAPAARTDAPAAAEEAPGPDAARSGGASDGQQVQVTTPQAAAGALVPDQSTGEAELATAADGEPAGDAGGAMPMMAGAGAGAADAGRAGTGWSVHGDLFDNGDPVYSMHGVLGEDDLEGR